MASVVNEVKTPEADYEDMRPSIQSGDLLAWSSDGATLMSRILTFVVRIFTLSEYSHVGIALREGDRVYVLEATIPRIQLRLLSERKGFYHVPMHVLWSQKLEDYLKHYIGKPYGILDCIRGYLGHTDPSDDRWQCAELCNDFYRQAEIDLGENYTPSKVVREAISRRRTSIIFIK